MHMYDILNKKRMGLALTRDEIAFFVRGYTSGEIPDYQASALLMAICIHGMSDEETASLTLAMAHSGDTADLSHIPGVKADKHSTGGVGDKTTLIVAPLAAACGVTVAKMSGRGLGYTGGTIDKLESIPGFSTQQTPERFARIAGETGLCIVGQSGNLAPADKKLYALRDVTATVESIPLIASSIMSKKLAGGSDCIVLDVKTGNGAFMKTLKDSISLAQTMVAIGTHAGKKTAALITDMNRPLGMAVGNALEVEEACRVLKGEGPDDLRTISIELAAMMVFLAGKAASMEDARASVQEKLEDGSALKKFREWIASQGGDPSVIENPELLPHAKVSRRVCAGRPGWIDSIDTQGVGRSSVLLGAGRETKSSRLDYGAGIRFYRKLGDWVDEGDVLAEVFAPDEQSASEGAQVLRRAICIGQVRAEIPPLFYAMITENKNSNRQNCILYTENGMKEL